MRQKRGDGVEKVIGNLDVVTGQKCKSFGSSDRTGVGGCGSQSGSNSAVSGWWEEEENTGGRVRHGLEKLLICFLTTRASFCTPHSWSWGTILSILSADVLPPRSRWRRLLKWVRRSRRSSVLAPVADCSAWSAHHSLWSSPPALLS